MLHVFGLTATEQALYELLLTLPPTSAEELDEQAECQGWCDESVGPALDRLLDLGLIVGLPDEPPRYAAAPAGPALDALIATRERELEESRQYVTELAARHRSVAASGAADAVEVIQDRAVAWRYYEDIHRSARREIRSFDAPPYLYPKHECNPLAATLLASGIRYRVMYDRQALETPGAVALLREAAAAGEESRITDVPIKLVLSDHPHAFVPLGQRGRAQRAWLIVREPVLCEALSALFEAYWENALPLKVAERSSPTPNCSTPTDPDRALLALLAAGLTDQAIAMHLGLHKRTAHSRIRSVMDRLDATTRFQAGHQAVRRGWLTKPADGGPDATVRTDRTD